MRFQLSPTTSVALGWTLSAFALAACAAPPPPDIPPNAVVPSAEQLAYQQMEYIGFVHFTDFPRPNGPQGGIPLQSRGFPWSHLVVVRSALARSRHEIPELLDQHVGDPQTPPLG